MRVDKGSLNVPLINQIIADMEADDGEAILMNSFLIAEDKFVSTGCGAAGCIAGWAYMVAFKDATIRERKALNRMSWENTAAELLGIPRREYTFGSDAIDTLFYMNGSYMSLKEFDYLEPAQRKRTAIELLTHLRDTGFIDWDRALGVTLDSEVLPSKN